ncbi:MAG: SPFH domain-containing protein [Cocleimonas sp.]|nr:SPFH domain-containing protein [Cocleimonas sp.]
MSLWDKVFGEFIDIIEWTEDNPDTMVYRYERYGNEIKYGAKLTVRETQVAVFVNEGQIADILTPGLYELETKNLPILSTLQHWDHGFESPFKAEVYFFNMRQFTDLKWGTKNPIMLRDKEFSMVRLRTFGSYSIRINDPKKFMMEILGTDGHFTVTEISDQLRNIIVSRYTNILGKSNIPVLDLAGNYDALGKFITKRISPEFDDYGLDLTKILVENISLPSVVEEALDKRTSMGMIGDLDKYLKYNAAESLASGAGDGSGTSAMAMEMGIGLAVGQQMSHALQPKQASEGATHAAPPPIPGNRWHVALNDESTGPHSIPTIKGMVQEGVIAADTLVWSSGMAEWQPAIENSTFKVFLEQASENQPPPVPKKAN